MSEERAYLVPQDIADEYESWLEVTAAARRWAQFPTDADVEAAAVQLALELGHTMQVVLPLKAAPNTIRIARAVLQAIKEQM